LWLAETSQQPISQTTWLKVTPNCNHYTFSTEAFQAEKQVKMNLLDFPETF
jgi:hypothetical protein